MDRGEAMHVLITADPYLPVPPVHYGGIERIVDFLARGLVKRGHEVTLIARGESRTAGRLVPYGEHDGPGRAARLRTLVQLQRHIWRHRREADVVHSFGRLAGLLPILSSRRLPKIQSYQRAITWKGVRRAVRLARGSLMFTACSSSMLTRHSGDDRLDGAWRTIYNGVQLSSYDFQPTVPQDAPLVFLGRVERIKGAHTAIDIALRSGRRLLIAGNRVDIGHDADYFGDTIAPHLEKGHIEYIGPVDDGAKNRLLGAAAALLMPIEWDEPFGIVMVEAMACGTPVIGFRRGSVPEVVRDSATGFVVDTADEAAAAVERLSSIDRETVRRDCEERFSSDVIVDDYVRLYREALARRP
jgi:glycosyltransferase involved in cell wall biosynthesis